MSKHLFLLFFNIKDKKSFETPVFHFTKTFHAVVWWGFIMPDYSFKDKHYSVPNFTQAHNSFKWSLEKIRTKWVTVLPPPHFSPLQNCRTYRSDPWSPAKKNWGKSNKLQLEAASIAHLSGWRIPVLEMNLYCKDYYLCNTELNSRVKMFVFFFPRLSWHAEINAQKLYLLLSCYFCVKNRWGSATGTVIQTPAWYC